MNKYTYYPKGSPKVKKVEVNDKFVKDKLATFVKDTVEDTINNLLDAEADRLCIDESYQHTEVRKDIRA